MNKEELRQGLKRLEKRLGEEDVQSVFLEEGELVGLDSLVLGLTVSDELSFDMTCNFVDTKDYGCMLQYFGRLELDGMMEESPGMLTEYKLLQMVNTLNRVFPAGQLLYMQVDTEPLHSIGIRYTMRTELDREEEPEKCVDIIGLLMDGYELLCSVLMLLLDGGEVEAAMATVMELLEQ